MASPAPRCEFDGKKLLLRLSVAIPGDPRAISPVVQGVVYLINQLMDDVRFEKGGTEIHMKKA